MANSKYSQVVTAVLAALTGSGVNYTPDRAVRVGKWAREFLDESLTVVYYLIPDEDEDQELDFDATQTTAHFSIVAVHRYTPADENPFVVDQPDRPALQDLLVEDVKKRLRSNLTLGLSFVHTLRIPLTSRSPEDTWEPGWAAALMRLEVDFSFLDGEP